MCYAIPGKILEIQGNKVKVEYFGETKTAVNEIQNLKIGEYIYAQGGFVINRIPEKEALEILEDWKEIFFSLKEVDEENSQFNPYKSAETRKVAFLVEKIEKGTALTEKDFEFLLRISNLKEAEALFKAANYIRHRFQQNSCCVHGIIEISNYCTSNCKYCGISIHNKNISRYKMTKQEILEAVDISVNKYGFKALVLQSGENCGYTLSELSDILKTIKNSFPVLIFISFGEIGAEGLTELYKAGARGLLLRFETSNPVIFKALHPGYSLEKRIEEIRFAKKLGYLTITGSLIGLPGQTPGDLAKDIMLTKELGTDMFSFGPFLPHPETPMKDDIKPKLEEILKLIAVARFAAREEANVVITTGLETLDASGRKEGLLSGGSSVMINITPVKYRRLYSIYPNRAHEEESIEKQIQDTLDLLKDIGRAPTDLNYHTSR